jgi:hypothetical protein
MSIKRHFNTRGETKIESGASLLGGRDNLMSRTTLRVTRTYLIARFLTSSQDRREVSRDYDLTCRSEQMLRSLFLSVK